MAEHGAGHGGGGQQQAGAQGPGQSALGVPLPSGERAAYTPSLTMRSRSPGSTSNSFATYWVSSNMPSGICGSRSMSSTAFPRIRHSCGDPASTACTRPVVRSNRNSRLETYALPRYWA